jgi:demethylmenaquinone methyltransferase/2-methoxy-6-polyprenyl-1,4-benzoquinol methylase
MSSALQQQIEYYRARAGEYDQWFYRQGRYDHGPELNRRWFAEARVVEDALDAFKPAGSVLELACGTGIWTERLLRHAMEVTAVDASPEVLEIHRQKIQSSRVSYIQADLFTWQPARRFDVVFFGFWLSHVPPESFAAFWNLVRSALSPGGRFFLVDSLREPTSTAADHQLPAPAAATMTRRLNDGREFEIYKVFYSPEELESRLRDLGWDVAASRTAHYFLHAEGAPTIAAAC